MQSKLITILILSIVFTATALDYNLNGDCCVNLKDFALLAGGWLSVYDINALEGISGEWLEFEFSDPNRSPVVYSQQATVVQGESKTLSITATDNEDLIYSVQSISDSNAGSITGANTLPYILASNSFEFNADANYSGQIKIVLGANDGTELDSPCGGLTTATATINIVEMETPPTVQDINVSLYTYTLKVINLEAEDDGYPETPGKLEYIITTLPTSGYLLDPASWAGKISVSMLPYTVSSWGDSVVYITDTVSNDSFQWKANDGGVDANSGVSEISTVNIDVNEYPKDSLVFEGIGYAEVNDHNSLDLIYGSAVFMWLKTAKPYGGIMKKRDSSGVGYEVGISAGKFKVFLYDSNGLVNAFEHSSMVNTGSWVYCGFAFDPNYVEGYDAAIYVNGIPEYVSNLTNRQYDNDANLIIALRSRETFDGQLDKISFFGPLLGRVDIGDAFGVYSTSSNTLFERGDTTENIWGFGLISDLRYLCNDGNGTTITEEKFGWNGLIVDSGGDFWQPELNIRLHPDPIESYRRQRSYEFLNYNRETIPLNNDLKKVGSQRY